MDYTRKSIDSRLRHLKTIKQPLDIATICLNDEIKYIEKKLKAMNLGVSCYITIPKTAMPVPTELCYGRLNKKWQIYYNISATKTTLPLIEAQRTVRAKLLPFIPDLLDALYVETVHLTKTIKEKVSFLHAILPTTIGE